METSWTDIRDEDGHYREQQTHSIRPSHTGQHMTCKSAVNIVLRVSISICSPARVSAEYHAAKRRTTHGWQGSVGRNAQTNARRPDDDGSPLPRIERLVLGARWRLFSSLLFSLPHCLAFELQLEYVCKHSSLVSGSSYLDQRALFFPTGRRALITSMISHNPCSTIRISRLSQRTAEYPIPRAMMFTCRQPSSKTLLVFVLLACCFVNVPARSLSPPSVEHMRRISPSHSHGLTNLGWNFPALDNHSIAEPPALEAVQQAAAQGFTWANFIVLVYLPSASSSHIDRMVSQGLGPSDQALTTAITNAKKSGMSVNLRFMLVCETDNCTMATVEPSNATSFFESYTNVTTHFGSLCESAGADILTIGVELLLLSQNATYTDYWLGVINATRAAFPSGRITYSTVFPYEIPTFIHALDVLALDVYVRLQGDSALSYTDVCPLNGTLGPLPNNTALVAEFDAQMAIAQAQGENNSIPIIIAEFGIPSRVNGLALPYCGAMNLTDAKTCSPSGQWAADNATQALGYTAAMKSFAKLDPSVFEAVVLFYHPLEGGTYERHALPCSWPLKEQAYAVVLGSIG